MNFVYSGSFKKKYYMISQILRENAHCKYIGYKDRIGHLNKFKDFHFFFNNVTYATIEFFGSFLIDESIQPLDLRHFQYYYQYIPNNFMNGNQRTLTD